MSDAVEVEEQEVAEFIPKVNLRALKNKKLVESIPDFSQEKLENTLQAMIYGDKPSEEKEQAGNELYAHVCQIFNCKIGEVVYNDANIKRVVITNDGKMISANFVKIGANHIKDLFDGFQPKASMFTRYAMLNYLMPVNPKLNKYAYITDQDGSSERGFKFRKDLQEIETNLELLMQASGNQFYEINHINSKIDLYIPTAKVSKRHNDLIEEYFDIVFGKNYSLLAKRHASLYAFENRYGLSRPTLILYGDRGTWKNLHVEKFLGSIYKGLITKAVPNKNFNSYLDSKLLYFDEITGDKHGDLMAVYDELKEISGGSVNYISKKFGGDYAVDNGVFPVLISNDPKPVHIKDDIKDEDHNQFLVMELRYSEQSEERFNKLKIRIQKLGYRDFEDFFDDSVGYFIWTELFSVYSDMKKDGVGKHWRYGMPIPITEALKKIILASVPNDHYRYLQIIKDLYYGNVDAYPEILNHDAEMKQMFLAFNEPATKGCISHRLLHKIMVKERMPLLRPFIEALKRENILVSVNEKIQVSDKIYTGDKKQIDLCVVVDVDALARNVEFEGGETVYDHKKAKQFKDYRKAMKEKMNTEWKNAKEDLPL